MYENSSWRCIGDGKIIMKKRLYRNKKESKIAGVCLGISDYFGVDPVIIRLIFLVTFFLGAGPIAYVICWIVMPVKTD